MASLQQQLLKAGLANKNTARKINANKHKQTKATHKGKQQIADETRQATEQIQRKRDAHNRQLNHQKQAQADSNAMLAQIMQLIEVNKVNRAQAEIQYHFTHQKKVKRIYVTKALQERLGRGHLVIVNVPKTQENKYEVVPADIAEKIAQRDTRFVVSMNQSENIETAEDGLYAEYKIPDNLMW